MITIAGMPDQSPQLDFPQLDQVAVMGVGLIGGSIALAARQQGIARSVLGFGRNRERLEAARNRGIIDAVATEPAELKSAQLIVVCTPVDRIGQDVLTALQATAGTSTLITDAGSVKGNIHRAIDGHREAGRYVAAHPLAGSHETGFEHARADLFQNRVCVLTVPADSPALGRKEKCSPAELQVEHFWQRLGMRTEWMSADEHDRLLAMTSHLPHLAASAVAAQVKPCDLRLASTGYRDTTRVAAGDAALWTAIFSENQQALLPAVTELIATLTRFQQMLTDSDREKIRGFLEQGCEYRRRYREDGSMPDDGT
jgi:prephenate dehydrogenase